MNLLYMKMYGIPWEITIRPFVNVLMAIIFIIPLVIGIRKLVCYLKSEKVQAKLVEIRYAPEPGDDPNTVAVYEYEKNGEVFHADSDRLEFGKNLTLHVYKGKTCSLSNAVMYLAIVIIAAAVFFLLVNFVFLGDNAAKVKDFLEKLIPYIFAAVILLGGLKDVLAYIKGITVKAKIVAFKGQQPLSGEKQLVYLIYEYEYDNEKHRITAENPIYITNTELVGKEKNIRIYNGKIVDPLMILLYYATAMLIGGILYCIIYAVF